uniref:Uncharacterized protein n=1 Tax=Denticeps clupeoides TaxID=299321 RepID=A0AAY4BV53_9TELE
MSKVQDQSVEQISKDLPDNLSGALEETAKLDEKSAVDIIRSDVLENKALKYPLETSRNSDSIGRNSFEEQVLVEQRSVDLNASARDVVFAETAVNYLSDTGPDRLQIVSSPTTESVVIEDDSEISETQTDPNTEEISKGQHSSTEATTENISNVEEELAEPVVKYSGQSLSTEDTLEDLNTVNSAACHVERSESRVTAGEQENAEVISEPQIELLDTTKNDTQAAQEAFYVSAEEELRAIQKASEAADKYTETLKPQVVVARKQNYDSMEDSSESEPSPLLQRRKISSDSSSSGDYKANSPESVDDEEFIRRQLVEMGEDGEMDSATEKPKLLLKNLTIDLNASPKHSPSLEDLAEATHVIPLSQTVSREEMCVSNDNEIITTEGFNTADDSAHERVHGQKSTDECKVSMESLIDSPEEQSKGSSSVHVSSFTPGTASSTSVSSFDEDTDSSPSHKKKSLDSKHRKAKHRPHGQILPTIVDSSEEDDQHREEDNLKEQEKTREEQYSKKSSKKYKKDNDELRAQRKHEHPIQTSNISSIEDTSNTEDLEQAAEIDFISKTSGSELSKSIESETDEIAARPKPVLMIEETCSVPSISPYFPTESDRESQASEKPLKTADEAYEELMMKAETVKSMREKQRTPDIEPLYGGMTIEDYAYESLVEEPPFENQSRLHDTHVLDQSRISVLDYVQKLRKPEDVYEEMLQKREDLIPTEQQTLQDATPPVVPETCYVSILGSESMSYDELSRQQKEVLTPGTSPTQPSPISPASGSLSYDSPEVILIPSSSDEEDLKGEGKKDIDDSATRRDLYPIPDLKITQCSSNEEDQEEEEHEDVMPTDKGSTIDEQATTVNEPASTQSTEPISVICVMPPMPKVKPKVPPRPQIHAKPQIPQKPQLYSIPADPSKFGCGPEIVDQNSSMPAAPLHHVPVLFDPAIPTALETNATVVIPIPDTESLGPVESTASAVPPPFQHVPGTAAVLSTISVSIKSFPVTEVKVVKAQIAVSDPISAATPLHEPVIVKIPDVVSPLSIVPEPKLVETAKIPANPPCRIAEQTSHPAENSTLAATGKGPTVPFSVPGSVSRDQITTLPSLPVTIQMPDLVTSPVSTPDQELSTAVAVPASIINRSPDVSNARFSSIEPVQAAVPSPIPVPIQKAVISPLPEPSPVIVQMPDLVSSPSQVPICAFSSASVLASEITLIPNETRNQIPVVEPTPHPGPSPVLIEVVKPRLNLTAESAALPPQTGPSIPCPTLVADIQPPSRPPITVHTSSTISAVPPPPPPPPPPVPLTAYIPQAPTTTVAVVSPTIPAVSSTVASSAALRTLPCQPIQSVLADIQPRIEGVFPTSDAGPLNVSTITSSPQILPTLQTRQGHVVIILPRGSSFENISVINQAAQDVTNSVTVAATGSSVQASSQIPSVVPPLFSTPHVIPHSFSESVSTSIVPSTVTSTITTTTVASLVCHKQQSLTSIGSQETADVTAIPPPPIQPIFKAPPIKKPPVLSQETPTTGIKDSPKLEPSVTEMHTASSTLKHSTPPPVPPKPTCIPAGLKFSHKPGEIIRPPLSPQPTAAYRIPFDQPKAATLPRIREPPNVLSLSLTTPVESKLSATSPKSPLSPRFAKTLETYVVITLPSEPGTPVESITTQAPVRRASLPTSKIQTVSVSAVPPPKPIPQAEPLPTSPKDVAGIHSLTQETLCAPPLPPPRQEVTVPLPPLPVSIQIEPIVTLAAIPTLFQEVPSIVEMSALQNPVAPLPVSHLDQESIIPEPYSTRPVSLHSQEMSRLEQHVPVPECTETKSSVLQQQLPLETPAVLSGKQEPDISIGLALGSTSEPIPSVWVSEERQEIKMPTVAPFGIPQFAKSMESKDVYIPEIQEAIPGSGSPIAYTQFTQAVEGQQARGPENQQRATMPTGPVKITQFSKSIESQEIRGPEKVVSSVSQVFSAISTTGQQPETLPKVVTQVVTTEVQRTTTVSVVQERLQEEPVPESHNVAVTITPDIIPFKIQPEPKQNGRIHYPGDVIDLRTLKVNVTMTDKGMDLTAPESSRQSVSSDSSGRQSTAVQPEVVNLCNEIVPATTLSVVTDSITIVTCSATIASFKNTDKPLDLGSAMSTPLPLTTYKPFEPLAQIVYRPVNSQPMTRASTETPINLSHIAMESKTYTNVPVTIAPGILTSGSIYTPPLVPAYTDSFANDAVDLTTSKPVKAIVALSSAGPVTSIVEDDGTPVDLTAGRQTVCCDVIYNLPFARSCRTQPPSTSLPDNYFGFTEDQMNYQNATTSVITDLSNIKKSVSDNNFTQAELFYYEGKNGFSYQNGASDHAIDLTSSRMSTGEYENIWNKMYVFRFFKCKCLIETSLYSHGVIRSSSGIVYSSVAEPVPSTYVITSQPGSIFSTTYEHLTGTNINNSMQTYSALQDQPSPYSLLPATVADQIELSKEILPSAFTNLIPSLTAFPNLYSDATLEAIAASLDALISPNLSGLDDSKTQQFQAEREFLELEKMKQLCLAEELEWERQEILRYREQEQLIVQKELEELHSMKHQLLLQQEEERQAHLILQQETFAQQQLQLEQIHQLQQQLQQQLEEQKCYPFGFEQLEGISPPRNTHIKHIETEYPGGDNGHYWPVKDDTSISSAVVTGQQSNQKWGTVPSDGFNKEPPELLSKTLPSFIKNEVVFSVGGKKIVESCVQTDDEDGIERPCTGRRRRSKRSVDSCIQTDDEDQDDWDVPVRSRRRSRSSKYVDGEKGKGSKVSSIAIQTVAEISVQTDHSGTIRRSPVRAQLDTKVEIADQKQRAESCQTETDSDGASSQKDKRRPTPIEIGVSTHLKADATGIPSIPKSPKVLYSPVSPVSPNKSIEFGKSAKSGQKMLTPEPSRHSPGSPRSLKTSQRSLSDPKSLSPNTDDRLMSTYHYSESYSSKGSQSGTPYGSQKKVKRTLPHPPPEEDTIIGPSGYSTGSARRRMCRNTTMARAKILQDIDKELDLVERESSKLRKKQAELDEEEKEIDAKLRYLEMGINRRKEALLKEREKRERAYLQGVAEERDYMSDSEVSNIREARGNGHGLERPRTAPQSEFNQFIPPQTETGTQYGDLSGPYSHYQYAPQTQAATHYPQQTLYQQQSMYHQQVSPYQTQSIYSSVPTRQQSQGSGYQHASQLLLMQQKPRQATLSDLEPKITTNYEVIRNQPLLMVPTSTDNTYGVSHLGGKYSSLDLRMGLEERSSMASSPMSSISAESFYADLDHHNARNYVLIDDIGELTKGSTGLGSSFNIPDKDMTKADRLLRAAEVRRTAEVADFLGPLQTSGRLHSYGKTEEDSMEEPYELKLLKQQIKQEFRRGTEGLDPLTGLPHYLAGDSSYRHFPKAEKYSISRLTLEKQAAKQLPASVIYQKQVKQKKAALMDPKITKFSPIQENRDLEPDYSSFLASTGSSVAGLSTRARLLQDEITFGLRKNIAEQQKYLGSTLGANLAQSLNLGQSLNLSPNMRSALQDDGTYPSGSRSRPSSRPSSVYGLDLSMKRDLSSSSLRLKSEGEGTDATFGSARAKPTSLPISQSRGRIPIVAQNSEEESPLSPVGQPMGMARASAGPLPPISADSRDQYGSSHSLPEVQQHMREESRTRGYDRDIAFMMDDLQGAMSDSEAYHLRQEESDWFDKPREGRGAAHSVLSSLFQKSLHYPFPHTRIKVLRDLKDHSVSGKLFILNGNGLGIRIVGGKEVPGTNGEIGAYVAKVSPGGQAEQSGKIVEGMQVLEWNGITLAGKTYEQVQSIVGQQSAETELCVRLDLNMLSDVEHPQQLELHPQMKRSPGVDPKQLAAELQKVSQQQTPAAMLAALEKGGHIHSGPASASSSAVPSPGQPGSPSVNKKRHSSKSTEALKSQPHPITGEIQLQINYDKNMGNLIVHVLQARNLAPRDNNGYSDPFVKVYLLPGRGQVMVVQNASAENKRRTKCAQKTQNPEWNQTVIYKNIHLEQLKRKTLEVTVWDYDRYSSNDFLGEVLIDLSNTTQLDNVPRWHPLKEQSESIHHGRAQPPQGNQQTPKNSVIKSRSHGIFPDPSKDSQMPTIEKSHSSPGSSKSSSESHLRSHGPSRSQSKSSVTQAHLEDAGNAIAAAEAAVQQSRLQPKII